MSYGTHTVVQNGTEQRLGLWPALEKARPAEGAVKKPVVGELHAKEAGGGGQLTNRSTGSWLMLPGHSLARMTAQMGYDFVLVDCEHGKSQHLRSQSDQANISTTGNIADADMHASVAAVAAAGSSPIVRIPAPENWMVKRALDAGAHGLLCPMMGTAVSPIRFFSPRPTAHRFGVRRRKLGDSFPIASSRYLRLDLHRTRASFRVSRRRFRHSTQLPC